MSEIVETPERTLKILEMWADNYPFDIIAKELGLSGSRIRAILAKFLLKTVEENKRLKLSFKERQKIRIEDCDFSVRTKTCMKNWNIVYLYEALEKSDKELLAIPNFGKVCLKELRSADPQTGEKNV